eukprot:Opistho-2@82914
MFQRLACLPAWGAQGASRLTRSACNGCAHADRITRWQQTSSAKYVSVTAGHVDESGSSAAAQLHETNDATQSPTRQQLHRQQQPQQQQQQQQHSYVMQRPAHVEDEEVDTLSRSFGRGSGVMPKQDGQYVSPSSHGPQTRVAMVQEGGDTDNEPFSMFSRANSVADALGQSVGHIASLRELDRTPPAQTQGQTQQGQIMVPVQKSKSQSPNGSSESVVSGSTGSGSVGKQQGEYSLWRSMDDDRSYPGDMFSQSWPLVRGSGGAQAPAGHDPSGRSSGLGSRPSSRSSQADQSSLHRPSSLSSSANGALLGSSGHGAGGRTLSFDSGTDVGDVDGSVHPAINASGSHVAVQEEGKKQEASASVDDVGEGLELEYLNEMADAIASAGAGDTSGDIVSAVSLTASALNPHDSGTAEDDEGYGQRQRLAEMVMRKTVNFDKVHEPTSTWSGLGFSKSTPEGTLRDLLREHAHSSPSIGSETSFSRRDSVQSHGADSIGPYSTDDDSVLAVAGALHAHQQPNPTEGSAAHTDRKESAQCDDPASAAAVDGAPSGTPDAASLAHSHTLADCGAPLSRPAVDTTAQTQTQTQIQAQTQIHVQAQTQTQIPESIACARDAARASPQVQPPSHPSASSAQHAPHVTAHVSPRPTGDSRQQPAQGQQQQQQQHYPQYTPPAPDYAVARSPRMSAGVLHTAMVGSPHVLAPAANAAHGHSTPAHMYAPLFALPGMHGQPLGAQHAQALMGQYGIAGLAQPPHVRPHVPPHASPLY